MRSKKIKIATGILMGLLLLTLHNTSCKGQNMNEQNRSETPKFNKLTEEEKEIIEEKGTEAPNSGKYNDHYKEGTYTCKKCDLPLYRSSDKFKSNCGWPSFDDEVPGAIKRQPDEDGVRTEIICAYCDAHLGHVFKGEQLTPKNVRHCVNSISMNFIPKGDPLKRNKAIFAAGCFWGVQHFLKRIEGVIDTRVGYIGGSTEKPTYEEVSSGSTGHAEAVEVIYDPREVSYDEMVKTFFEIHDFTQVNRQGPDVGEQYRSEIFFTSQSQKKIAEKYKKILEDKGYDVATTISQAKTFWAAEEYHQDYYKKNNSSPYCHSKRDIFED